MRAFKFFDVTGILKKLETKPSLSLFRSCLDPKTFLDLGTVVLWFVFSNYCRTMD